MWKINKNKGYIKENMKNINKNKRKTEIYKKYMVICLDEKEKEYETY